MVKVTVDVTGMYFSFKVDVDPKSSVQTVMEAVQSATVGSNQEFNFVPKPNPYNGHLYMEEISVLHKVTAKAERWRHTSHV